MVVHSHHPFQWCNCGGGYGVVGVGAVGSCEEDTGLEFINKQLL